MTRRDVPDLILGTAQLVTDYGVTRSDRPVRADGEACEFLKGAERSGITVLDTAPAYGRAEEVIGSSGVQFTIHTKICHGTRAIDSLRSSLHRLNCDSIDVLYVHDVDDFRRRPAELDYELRECLESGTRRTGVSLYGPEEIDMATKYRSISVVQVPMNVLDRRFIGSIERLRDNGIGCIVRSVFLQGTLLCPPGLLPSRVGHLAPFVREYQDRCLELGVSPLVASLSFVAQLPGVDGVIVGAQDIEEMAAIVDAWSLAAVSPDIGKLIGEIHVPDGVGVDPRRWR